MAKFRAGVAADKIYRTTDSQGHAVFSDSAPESAQPVEVDKTQTYPAGKNAADYDRFKPDRQKSTNDGPPYTVLRITSPENQTSIRSNPGNLQIAFDVNPGIRPGQILVLLMDGKPIQRITAQGPIQLTNIDRGTHTVQLQAVDPETSNVLQSSSPVTFTLHRHSILQKKPKI